MPTGRPTQTEYAPFYARYLDLVAGEDALASLEAQVEEIRTLTAAVPAEKETYRYAAEKWSVREVMGHVVDAERVFGYRAFCIGRGEQASLPAFDENAYVAASAYGRVPLADLTAELIAVRQSNLTFLRRQASDDWLRTGTANGRPVSVRALGFMMVGHARHHLDILRSRYSLG